MRALQLALDCVADAFAPLRCAGCELVTRDALCAACTQAIRASPIPATAYRDDAVWIAAFEYADSLRAMIHRAKYRSARPALHALARFAAERISDQEELRGDGVIAVPLGRRRLLQRGYNQADVVAHALASAQRLPVMSGLVRVRETAPQAERHEDARRRNVEGAFEWRGPGLVDAALWLVDDVVTTGATASAAIAALRAAGAARVHVAALACVP